MHSGIGLQTPAGRKSAPIGERAVLGSRQSKRRHRAVGVFQVHDRLATWRGTASLFTATQEAGMAEDDVEISGKILDKLIERSSTGPTRVGF
jgi:hypothetical protein